MDIRQKIGQRLVFGFRDPEPTEDFIRLIRKYKIGNVILFRGNIKSCEQVKRLCDKIQRIVLEETGQPAFIAIDQEGGRISRLPYDAVNVPGAMALAATGDAQNAYLAASITARQLRGLGINMPLAPVLDVNSNARNPVIGVRSFGDQASLVAAFGCETVRAYREQKVLCCGKHFPGHGDTAVDSHIGLPLVNKALDALSRMELVPFQAAIDAGIPAIMSSHILFPCLEKDRVPATMSRRIMHDLLREKMGFQGLVLSDCMVMDAIQKYYGTARGVVAAMQAGVDLVFVCSNPKLQIESAQAALDAALAGEIPELDASVERILAAKKVYAFSDAQPGLASRPEDFAAVDALSLKAVTLVYGTPFVADGSTFYCGCADYRSTPAQEYDPDALPFPEYMQKHLGGACRVCGKDPSKEEISEIVHQAAAYQSIVFSTCNAHMFTGQLALAEALSALHRPFTVIALRDPYDLSVLSAECTAKLAAFDYTSASMRALAKVLRGAPCGGVMPVSLP